jgi:glucans biosynthesis protein
VTILEAESMTLEERRLASMRAAPRCLARTRRSSLCQCPAIKGKKRCQRHGGKSVALKGEANGAWKHGGWTVEAIELRREASRLLKEVRESC